MLLGWAVLTAATTTTTVAVDVAVVVVVVASRHGTSLLFISEVWRRPWTRLVPCELTST
jgi:hypothetical protein